VTYEQELCIRVFFVLFPVVLRGQLDVSLPSYDVDYFLGGGGLEYLIVGMIICAYPRVADPGLAHAQYSPARLEGFKCAAWDICEYDIRVVVVDVVFSRRQTL